MYVLYFLDLCQTSHFYSSLCLPARTNPISKAVGNRTATNIPVFKFPFALSATQPTTPGPLAQPKSPARAKKANIAVPPVRIVFAAMLNVPGHITPTEKPQTAQPSNPNREECVKEINR